MNVHKLELSAKPFGLSSFHLMTFKEFVDQNSLRHAISIETIK